MLDALPAEIKQKIRTKNFESWTKTSPNSLRFSSFSRFPVLFFVAFLTIISLFLTHDVARQNAAKLVSSQAKTDVNLTPLADTKKGYQVFGFAPYWTLQKLSNVDFSVLTTLAYFSVGVGSDGNLITDDSGYRSFMSRSATSLFAKAHKHNTSVVLTITQMDNWSIEALLNSQSARERAISQVVSLVKKRGIDGVNIDFEYSGGVSQLQRNEFSSFVDVLTSELHRAVPGGRVTVSVYALSVKNPNLYDIQKLGQVADGVFMMAYDFAVAGSESATPTDPLYGYREGRYSYDVSTAVADFLKLMPAKKLILGVPYYGYNYLVYAPGVKSETLPYYSWKGQPYAVTYSTASAEITPAMEGVDSYRSGWDSLGEVGWKAYHIASTNTWRMIFLDNSRSLSLKYEFAKSKQLAGVGIWALGFDDGRQELWAALKNAFGTKLADNTGILR